MLVVAGRLLRCAFWHESSLTTLFRSTGVSDGSVPSHGLVVLVTLIPPGRFNASMDIRRECDGVGAAPSLPNPCPTRACRIGFARKGVRGADELEVVLDGTVGTRVWVFIKVILHYPQIFYMSPV